MSPPMTTMASGRCTSEPGPVANRKGIRPSIATVAVNQFTFKQAVSVGDVASLYGRVEKIGRTSITVHMEVWAERNPSQPQLFKVTEANITYVAIDLEGKPRPIHPEQA